MKEGGREEGCSVKGLKWDPSTQQSVQSRAELLQVLAGGTCSYQAGSRNDQKPAKIFQK